VRTSAPQQSIRREIWQEAERQRKNAAKHWTADYGPDKPHGEDERQTQHIADDERAQAERAFIGLQARQVPHDADGQREKR
jgi:hypothetical protein